MSLNEQIARIYEDVQSLTRQMNNTHNFDRKGELRRKIAKLEWEQQDLILQANRLLHVEDLKDACRTMSGTLDVMWYLYWQSKDKMYFADRCLQSSPR